LGLIIVEVMPKPEILDPQGKAVRGAFLRHGVDVFTDVRQGKRFQLSVEGPVTEAQPWAHQVLTRAWSQPGEGISSSSMKMRASEPRASLRARLRPATIPGSGSWT